MTTSQFSTFRFTNLDRRVARDRPVFLVPNNLFYKSFCRTTVQYALIGHATKNLSHFWDLARLSLSHFLLYAGTRGWLL